MHCKKICNLFFDALFKDGIRGKKLNFPNRYGKMYWQFDRGEGLAGTVPNFQDPAGEMDIYMRLRREGDAFTAWWKRKANLITI